MDNVVKVEKSTSLKSINLLLVCDIKVLTDSGGRMIPEELDKSIEAVKASGKV